MRRQINFGFATLEFGIGRKSKTLTKDIDASEEFLRSNDFELGTKNDLFREVSSGRVGQRRYAAGLSGDRQRKLLAFVAPNNLDRLRQLEDIVNTSVQEVERLYEVGRPALVIS